MGDAAGLVLGLVGVVVGIVLMVAQFQLFAIRRLLETLVQQTRPEGAPFQTAGPDRSVRHDNLPPVTAAEQKKGRIIALTFFTFLIVLVGFVIFALLSPK